MSITNEPWFKEGLDNYKRQELAVKRFWRAALRRRRRDRKIRQMGLEAVNRAILP